MVGIYGRQSLDIKESISIETQINKCKIRIDDAPHKIYVDKGFSGKNIDRPDFQKLVNDIESGLITKVIVYKIDRISRSIMDFGGIMNLFDKHDIEFASVNENFDTATPIGRAMLNIIMVFAQLERETIQQRTRDNFFARMENAFGMTGVAPFGYKKVPIIHMNKKTHTYEVDPETSRIVEKIYDTYANDYTSTLLSIAHGLTNDPSIPRNFNHSFIVRILKNPFYVKADSDIYKYLLAKGVKMTNTVDDYLGENGVYIYGSERREMTKCHFSDEALMKCHATVALHEGLINSDIWLKCQIKLKNKSAWKNSRKNVHPELKRTWLSGIMKCQYCGRTITARAGRNRDNLYIYCLGRAEHICYARTTPYKITTIEEKVEKELLSFLKARTNVKIPPAGRDNSKINRLKIEITKLDEKINNLVSAIKNGSVSTKYLNEEIEKLDNQKNEKLLEINVVTAIQEKNDLDHISMKEIVEQWSNFDVNIKKQIARAAIEKIIISNEGLDIYFY